LKKTKGGNSKSEKEGEKRMGKRGRVKEGGKEEVLAPTDAEKGKGKKLAWRYPYNTKEKEKKTSLLDDRERKKQGRYLSIPREEKRGGVENRKQTALGPPYGQKSKLRRNKP